MPLFSPSVRQIRWFSGKISTPDQISIIMKIQTCGDPPACRWSWISWSSTVSNPWSAVPLTGIMFPPLCRIQTAAKVINTSSFSCPPQSLRRFSPLDFTSWPTCCRSSRRAFAAPLSGAGGEEKPAERAGRRLRVKPRHWTDDSLGKQRRETKRELLPAEL